MSRKQALVTGAGRGIGRQIALTLAGYGYDVGVNYSTSEAGALEVCREIEANGGRAEPLKASVSNLDQIEAMFAQFSAAFGAIDLLVNNAGVTRMAPFLETTEALFDEVTGIDWKGAFFTAQAAARNMVAHGTPGVIVNITSNQQDGCWPRASVYGPTKAALMKFTRHAALELARYSIRVVAVAPGYTVADPASVNVEKTPAARIPLKRFGDQHGVAEAVAYLASDKAHYITGACLSIDGGALLPIVPAYELE